MMNRIVLTLIAAQFMFAAVNYSYDAAGRLVKVDYGSAGSIAYSYDKGGNLLSRTVSAGSGATAGTITSAATAFAPVSAGIAQNTWLAIKGTNLVPATTPAAGVIWSAAPEFLQGKMPTTLGGISVTINGKPGYIYFYCSAVTSTICTADQINVLSPLDTTLGDVQVVVTNGTTPTPPFTATMHAIVPVLFEFDATHVVATHLNNSLIGPPGLFPGNAPPTTPASSTEQVVVYGSGFGLPNGTLTPGSSSQGGSLATLPVCTVGTNPATNSTSLAFAGLVGPGLIQMNINLPKNLTAGDQPITCTYGGATTPANNVITVVN